MRMTQDLTSMPIAYCLLRNTTGFNCNSFSTDIRVALVSLCLVICKIMTDITYNCQDFYVAKTKHTAMPVSSVFTKLHKANHEAFLAHTGQNYPQKIVSTIEAQAYNRSTRYSKTYIYITQHRQLGFYLRGTKPTLNNRKSSTRDLSQTTYQIFYTKPSIN